MPRLIDPVTELNVTLQRLTADPDSTHRLTLDIPLALFAGLLESCQRSGRTVAGEVRHLLLEGTKPPVGIKIEPEPDTLALLSTLSEMWQSPLSETVCRLLHQSARTTIAGELDLRTKLSTLPRPTK